MPTFDETIRAIAQEELPQAEHHLIDTYQDSTYFWANKNLSMMRAWIIETDLMLEKSLDETDVRSFYIHLHGIVDEMYGHFSKRFENLKDLFNKDETVPLVEEIEKLDGDFRMKTFLRLSIETFKNLNYIRNEFTDFELKQIMFFRHQFCHPLLTKLSVKINRKKRFTGVEVDKLMREITEIDELESMTRFHAILLGKRKYIKEVDDLLRSMQFS